MIKAKPWNEEDLKGDWIFSFKVDGVRALWNGTEWLSRKAKPLYNLPKFEPIDQDYCEDVEVFLGTFKDTVKATRTHNATLIKSEHLYKLNPLDCRLLHTILKDPTARSIKNEMKYAINLGYEGLVLRQGNIWLKVKPEETHDVPITGIREGTGKFKGFLGSLLTSKGAVGTGFTDQERKELWKEANTTGLIGQTVEVSCMHLTPDDKFRHPRFIRLRPDK